MKHIPPELRFLTLRTRSAGYVHPIDVFRQFIDDEVLDFLNLRFDAHKLVYSIRNRTLIDGQRSQRLKTLALSTRDQVQVFAIYIRIIGMQYHASGADVTLYGNIRNAINACIQHFQQDCPPNVRPINMEKARRLLAHMTMDGNEAAALISKKFQNMVLTLGGIVAGDEKLFTFHGESGNVRLVPSKPGKVGLWEYELCGRFKSGEPYLLYTSLHDFRDEIIKVSRINRAWIEVIKTTGDFFGSEREIEGANMTLLPTEVIDDDSDHEGNQNSDDVGTAIMATSSSEVIPTSAAAVARARDKAEFERVVAIPNNNPLTYYFSDSYYLDATSRRDIVANNMNYAGSAKIDRFEALKRRIHPPGSTNKEGEWRGLYNENTGETFVYHYDTQKGVGIKYNLSLGFERSTIPSKVRSHKDSIPAYDDYKLNFDMCDGFNAGLFGNVWSFKRGGHGVSGEFGCQHDFIMACVLQNTYTSWKEINDRQIDRRTFFLALTDEVFKQSLEYYPVVNGKEKV